MEKRGKPLPSLPTHFPKLPMTAKTPVLLKVSRKFAHRQKSVEHKCYRNLGNDRRDHTGITLTEKKPALEHLRDPPHDVLADEDGRDESHVAPHEQAEKKTARALQNIKSRRPTAFSRFLVQSDSGDDIDRPFYSCEAPCCGTGRSPVRRVPILTFYVVTLGRRFHCMGLTANFGAAYFSKFSPHEALNVSTESHPFD
jgi:hypothetical protein